MEHPAVVAEDMRAIRTFATCVAILAATTGLGQGTFQFSNIGLPGRPLITAGC